MTPIFDGHNDVLLRLWRNGDRDAETFFSGKAEARARGHIDLPRAVEGGLAAGFFAIYVMPQKPPRSHKAAADRGFEAEPQDYAMKVASEQASILLRMESRSQDRFRIVRSVGELRKARRDKALAAIFHMEGAEAIGPDLAELDLFYAAGLRSLGPVWSRPTIFAHGVPFRFPSSPDIGPGLTEVGKRLIRRCNELRIMVDLSHMNEKGFWDIAKITDAPLVATHSNVHAICPSSRNLTDKQLDAIAESRGVVGLNYAVAFLREDGAYRSDTPFDIMIRHLTHLIEKLGEDGVALGSDFDGAMIPRAIGDVAGLQNLVGAMREAGFGRDLIKKICYANWENLLARTWGT